MTAGQHKATVVLDGQAGGMNKAMREASMNTRTLEDRIEKLEKELTKANTKLDRYGTTAQKSAKQVDQAGTKTVSATEKFKRQAAMLGGLGATLTGTALAVDKLAERQFNLSNVTKNLPFSIDAAREATMGLVSDYDLMQQAIQANRLGVARNEKDFAKAAQTAVKLGVSVGQDATQALDDFVNGLGRGSTEVLDNLGIMLRAEEAYKIYAEQLGKTAAELTDVEKRQAVVTVGMDRGADMARKATVDVDGWGAAWERAKTTLANTADQVINLTDNTRELSKELLTGVGLNSEQADRSIDHFGESMKDTAFTVATFGIGPAVQDLWGLVDAEEEAARTIERGKTSFDWFATYMTRQGSITEKATKTLEGWANGIAKSAEQVKLQKFVDNQIAGMNMLTVVMQGNAKIQAAIDEANLERRKKMAAAAKEAAMADMQLNIDGARREVAMAEDAVHNGKATTSELIALIDARLRAEEELAVFQLRHAESRADQLRTTGQLLEIYHQADMERIRARQEAEQRLSDFLDKEAEKAFERDAQRQAFQLARKEQGFNQEMRVASRIDDPVKRIEAETAARIALIDVQMRAANDPIERMALANEKEQSLHDLRMARIEAENKAYDERLGTIRSVVTEESDLFLNAAQSVFEASIIQGASLKRTVADTAKSLALRHAFLAASETIRGSIALASLNFPLATAHFKNAGQSLAFSMAMGAVGGSVGAFKGMLTKSTEGGFTSTDFGPGGGGGSRGGGSPSSGGRSQQSQIPESPTNSPFMASTASAGGAQAPVTLNFEGANFIGTPPKEFIGEIERQLRDRAYGYRKVG